MAILSTLNTYCLSGVLSQLPIGKQLQYRLLSSLWNDLLRRCLRNRTSLALYEAPKCFPTLTLRGTVFAVTSALTIPLTTRPSTDLFTLLHRLCPKIGQIEICSSKLTDQMVSLLGQTTAFAVLQLWSATLSTVAISSPVLLDSGSARLWAVLVELPKLRHLYIETINELLDDEKRLSSDVQTVLGRLQTIFTTLPLSEVHFKALGSNLRHLYNTTEPITRFASKITHCSSLSKLCLLYGDESSFTEFAHLPSLPWVKTICYGYMDSTLFPKYRSTIGQLVEPTIQQLSWLFPGLETIEMHAMSSERAKTLLGEVTKQMGIRLKLKDNAGHHYA